MIKTVCFSLLLVFTNFVFANQKIMIFAAASLSDALEEINHAYHKIDQKHDVIFSFASSSTLARQIEYGAPADIFISADKEWMNYVTAHRAVVAGPDILLKNDLVLIAPRRSPLTLLPITPTTNWHSLLAIDDRLALGDPAHVPAGKYAKESLSYLGVYKQLKSRFAYANNVRAALRLVELGEAGLGIVYATDAKISNKVKVIGHFPKSSFTPIEYPVALLNSSAKSFYDFLKTPEAQTVFKKYGFILL